MGNWHITTWTTDDWWHTWTLCVTFASLALVVYNNFFEQFLLIWVPKPGGKFAHAFWLFIDKIVLTLKLVALHSSSKVGTTDVVQNVTKVTEVQTTETAAVTTIPKKEEK